MVKVFALRFGDKYGPEYEDYLKSKLPDITFFHDIVPPFLVHWNKIRAFNFDYDEPICLVDIDLELTNDYMELFEYPIKRGEFVSIPAHWGDVEDESYSLNGGFYKFYPEDTRYIYQKFLDDPNQNKYYVEKLELPHPFLGEQYFVEDSVKERLELKLVPDEWVQRGLNGKFLDDGEVKLVHHSWDKV